MFLLRHKVFRWDYEITNAATCSFQGTHFHLKEKMYEMNTKQTRNDSTTETE